jgi:hypothetical protein
LASPEVNISAVLDFWWNGTTVLLETCQDLQDFLVNDVVLELFNEEEEEEDINGTTATTTAINMTTTANTSMMAVAVCDMVEQYRPLCPCLQDNEATTTTTSSGEDEDTTEEKGQGGRGGGGKKKGRFRIHYMSADTKTKKAWLAWTPRLPALLSILGSSFVLWDIFQPRHFRKKKTVYQILVALLSAFDIVGSLAWFMSTWPIPDNYPIYGAQGNDATCKAQGFFIQLSIGGPLTFVSLTFFFLWTIRYNMRESKIQKWKWALVLPPCLGAVIMAFIGLPHYQPIYLMCHLRPIDWQEGSIVQYFSVFPIALALTCSAVCMILTYAHVRKTENASSKWRFGRFSSQLSTLSLTRRSSCDNGSNLATTASATAANPTNVNSSELISSATSSRRSQSSQLSMAVFWQFVLYTVSFYLTWPIYFSAVIDINKAHGYVFWIALEILVPLQGMWNAVAYFRPVLVKKWTAYQQRRGNNTRLPQQNRNAAAAAGAMNEAQEQQDDATALGPLSLPPIISRDDKESNDVMEEEDPTMEATENDGDAIHSLELGSNVHQ